MFRIGLENNTEGRSQVWVLGHPGCFAYGQDGPAAVAPEVSPGDGSDCEGLSGNQGQAHLLRDEL